MNGQRVAMRGRSGCLPRAAVFVDAENQADLDVRALLEELRLWGFRIVEKHAYADWRNRCLSHFLRVLSHAGFATHQAWSGYRPGARKNTADGHMERGIERVLSRRPNIDMVVIVSGDAFFAPVARRLRRQGKGVIVASAPRRTSRSLRSEATRYLPLGGARGWAVHNVRAAA